MLTMRQDRGSNRKSRMRILLFLGWDMHCVGGAQISVIGLAKALRAAGHIVAVAGTSPGTKPPGRMDSSQGIRYWSFPELPAPRSALSWMYFIKSVWRLHFLLRRFRPDVVSVQAPA